MNDRQSAILQSEDAPSKSALLLSALRLFVANGIFETTIRGVAEDAGFSNPAIFKFFRSRDELAVCVFERGYERLFDSIKAAASVHGFEARLRSITAAATMFMDQDLDSFIFVTEQLRRFWPKTSARVRRKSILKILGDLFVLGRVEGRVAADHDTALLTAAVVGILTQLARALYFGEIKGPATRRSLEIERLIARMSW
jgi:AcrR family transcriptional regulator